MTGYLNPQGGFNWGQFGGDALQGLGAGLLARGAGGQYAQQAPLIGIQALQQAQAQRAEAEQRALQNQSLTQEMAIRDQQASRQAEADRQARAQQQAYLGLIGGQPRQGPVQPGQPALGNAPTNPTLSGLPPAIQSMLPAMSADQGMALVAQMAARKPSMPNLEHVRQGNQDVSGYFDPNDPTRFVQVASGSAFAPQQPQQPTERERYAALAGLKPGTPEYQNFMLTGGQQPDTFVDIPGPDGKPIGQKNLKTGQVVSYPQGPTKQPTAEQAVSGGFADRMSNSGQIIDKLENTAADLKQSSLSSLPGVANFLISPGRQQVEQAQRDFVNAVLRRESGAAISSSEFDSANKQYFPKPGDSKEVIAQKRVNRDIAIKAMKRNAGPVYEQSQSAAAPTQSNVAQPPVPGAAQAPDGNWYVADPQRPGKYLKVVQ